MKITWITGTKGGCGKSMMAALMVDFYHSAGTTPVVVEADGSVPDVGRRYDSLVTGILAPIGGSDPANEIYSLLEKIEDQKGETDFDRIVINLPGNTGVVESAATEIAAVTDAMGITNNTIFMIAENRDSAVLCAESLDRGLCSISEKKVAVINGHFGKTPDKFAWEKSAERRGWLKAGLPEMFLPDLHTRVRELPVFQKGFMSQMTAPGEHGLTVVNQMGVTLILTLLRCILPGQRNHVFRQSHGFPEGIGK